MRATLTIVKAAVQLAGIAAAVADESFCGIGVGIKNEGGAMRVNRVIPGSAAAVAGLTVGVTITHVDGKPVHGRGLQDVVRLIRGRKGSSVRLTVVKELGLSQEYRIVRAPIVRSRPDTLPGLYFFQDSPSTTVTLNKINARQFAIDCRQQHWSGVGLLGDGYLKGVFRMDEHPQVHQKFRGAISFFRIDFQLGDTLRLRSRFNFYDSGDKIIDRTLVRKTNKAIPGSGHVRK